MASEISFILFSVINIIFIAFTYRVKRLNDREIIENKQKSLQIDLDIKSAINTQITTVQDKNQLIEI
tara:strand:+ start:1100 stop:1300 length:201 start_codon:yes stop_codon:yes gene_type:complete